MTRNRFWKVLALVTLLVIGFPIIALWLSLGGLGADFWKDYASNSLATLIGAILAILTAFAVNEYQIRQEERREEKDRRRRETTILKLLKEELDHNRGQLESRRMDPQLIPPADTLKTEIYQAFSDGGEMKSIADPALVGKIADSYYYIHQLMALEDHLAVVHWTMGAVELREQSRNELSRRIQNGAQRGLKPLRESSSMVAERLTE